MQTENAITMATIASMLSAGITATLITGNLLCLLFSVAMAAPTMAIANFER